MQKIMILLAVIAPLLAAGEGRAFTVSLPQTQVDFLAIVQQYQQKYIEAPNELKKSTVVRNRDEQISKLLPNKKFTNWFGQIDQLGTTSKGHAYITLKVNGYPFVIKTWNNDISDIGDDTLVKNGSPIYEILSEMQEGDWIKASGTLIKSPALTERGRMVDPEFIVRFSVIVPVTEEDADNRK